MIITIINWFLYYMYHFGSCSNINEGYQLWKVWWHEPSFNFLLILMFCHSFLFLGSWWVGLLMIFWYFLLHGNDNDNDVSSACMRRGRNELGRPRQFPGEADNSTMPKSRFSADPTFLSNMSAELVIEEPSKLLWWANRFQCGLFTICEICILQFQLQLLFNM